MFSFPSRSPKSNRPSGDPTFPGEAMPAGNTRCHLAFFLSLRGGKKEKYLYTFKPLAFEYVYQLIRNTSRFLEAINFPVCSLW